MTREPTYQAARAVAATVEAHFDRHLVEARRRGERELAHAPDARAIATIIDACFGPVSGPRKAASRKSRWPFCHLNRPVSR